MRKRLGEKLQEIRYKRSHDPEEGGYGNDCREDERICEKQFRYPGYV